MLLLKALDRGCDDYGCGHYGASRGKRKHRGIDYAAYYGQVVCSPVAGRVTKIGYPYSNDLSYKYVEITDSKNLRHRFFYVFPSVKPGQRIEKADSIGTVQDIAARYTKGNMTNHVHYEIKNEDNEYMNPRNYKH